MKVGTTDGFADGESVGKDEGSVVGDDVGA